MCHTLTRFSGRRCSLTNNVSTSWGTFILERSASQARMAWLSPLKKGWLPLAPWIVPIPGTTKLHRLEENLGAADVELTAADLAEIEKVSNTIEAEGEGYPR